MKAVNQPIRKKDAMALVTGKPVFMDDLVPKDCLIVKVLSSPHANAWVEDIKTGTAEKVAGIACVLTYKDVPKKRFTLAGQTAPEMSPEPDTSLASGACNLLHGWREAQDSRSPAPSAKHTCSGYAG